jgi:hypothetical protein
MTVLLRGLRVARYRHAIDEFIEWYCSEPRLRSATASSTDIARIGGGYSFLHRMLREYYAAMAPKV